MYPLRQSVPKLCDLWSDLLLLVIACLSGLRVLNEL